uniref:separase n=1 Tax=Erigeron canadensis TaxID=72917 RepID=UPI001CB8B3E7|nr:separase [Erigeron canadensis]
MADSGASEASLLSTLETSSDLSSIHRLFSAHLKPFSPVLVKLETLKKPSEINSETLTAIRSLAKKFLSFISKSLGLLPKRLTQTPQIDSIYVSGLFETFELCLRCLEAVSSQLVCKPHHVQIHRSRLMRCYENWGRYDDAEKEGESILEFIGNLCGGKVKGRVVPEFKEEKGDKDVAMLVFEVVVTMTKCVANRQSEKKEDYERVVKMVDDIQPWLRFIGADGYDKWHRMLVSYMHKCALFMVGKLAKFDEKLTHKFCVSIFSEYKRSSLNDQIEKFAHKICSSIFSQLDGKNLCSVEILTLVLDTMANECKIDKEKSNKDFLELVDYCAMKCRNATVDFCGAVATHFDKLAPAFVKVNLSPVKLILRLYAITLRISDLNYYSRGGNPSLQKVGNDMYGSKHLFAMENQLQSLRISISAHVGIYIPFYFTALKFLCEPLSVLINSQRKEILCRSDDMPAPVKLPNIENVFRQFRRVFDDYLCSESEKNNLYEDNSRSVLDVAIAAFTLSFITKKSFEENTSILTELISAEWVQANGLKYLYASLHNVGIVLYRTDRLKEATHSFKLCCQAAWNCVIELSKTRGSSKDKSANDLSEDAVTAFATETCAKSAFLLDILYQCGSDEINMILKEFLTSWFDAQNRFDKIPVPVALVKQWVKIQCKETKDPGAGNKAPTLYSLMSSILTMPTVGILLEQELQMYMEMKSLNPELSKVMRTAISNILLGKIYRTKDSYYQKFRLLIANAMELRTCGFEGLDECVKSLSEVISSMSDMYNKDEEAPGRVCDLLAEAYCLHALCTQEAEPNSKYIVQDIGKALKLWLSQEHSQSAEVTSQSTLFLLYHVGDMLSLKGYMEDHSEIFEMMFRYFTWKNFPIKQCLAMLWQSRSLSHALCTSTVSDAFILTLSQHCNLTKSKSMEFWISCMDKSKSLEVGFKQSFSIISTLSSPDSHKHDQTLPLVTIDEVKHAASDLIKNAPSSSKSLFLAAHLYFDLAERLVAKGSMVEALSYSKEAHRLRTRLLQENFVYTVEQHNDVFSANGELIQKRGYGLKSFHMLPSVATTVWSYVKGSSDINDFILTPWNVLRCYLESILQEGAIQETVGNGHKAEALLLWGRNISALQGLPIFLVSFSSALGKLYRKQQLWHLAEKELESAKSILADCCNLISCLKCRSILDVTVDQQLGDLFRTRFTSSTGNIHDRDLSKAETLYRSAADKLKLPEWNNCVSNPKETTARNTMFCNALFIAENDLGISSDCGNQAAQKEIQPKVTRKGKNTAKALPQPQRVSSRITRSSKQKSEHAQNNMQNFVESEQVLACEDAIIRKGIQKSKVDCIATCGCEVPCVCDDICCWHCLPFGVMKSLSVKSIIQLKWECTRRRLLIRLLIGTGKCMEALGQTQRAHEVFMESISVLVCRSTFQNCRSVSVMLLSDLIQKNVAGEVFAVEHASILLNICWFLLKHSPGKCTSDTFIPIPILVSGLRLSFILCREVPKLFQKVSRLLSILYTLAHLNETFSTLLSSGNAPSECHWAAYFHQASLGTHLNYQLFSRFEKPGDPQTMNVDGSCLSSSASLSSHRLAPESVLDLEDFVLMFFKGLPRTTIICISMLGDGYANWLRDLLPHDSPIYAWIMFSRLNLDCSPVVVVLPVDSILAGSSTDDEYLSSTILFDKQHSDKSWNCPWDHTIIDEVAPLFRRILEGNYLSSSGSTMEDTNTNRKLWWNQRRKLDQWLSDLLRDMEDLWFGDWKYLLLGELSDQKEVDTVQEKVMKDLKSKGKFDVQDSILRAVIGGGVHGLSQEECLSELITKKGCYIGGRKNNNVIREVGDEDFVDREPVILVPDADIQMLPWENMPVLRNQEVYRMPTVASISCTYDRCCHIQGEVGRDSAIFPMIDPLDAYYLLNPGGDLSHTEAEFGNWFKDQKLEGTSGTSPSVDELSVALKSHDLFIYLGHGSGVQYIPGDEIQKLERCAATLLMGCSSGSLSLNGSYTPKGAPLYYLFAGSPVIIANLWDVTDKDIDRFGKAMLDAWIKARSTTSVDCAQCTEISEKLNDMNVDGGKRKGKKKISQSKSTDAITSRLICKHRPKMGAFMGESRKACTLPYLIGAAPVCYGVPTGIRKKEL